MERGAQVGNENSAKGKDWHLAVKRALARRGEGDYRKGLDKIAEKVVQAAVDGDRAAWQDIADRFDGKAKQAVELSENPDAPLFSMLMNADKLRTKIRGE